MTGIVPVKKEEENENTELMSPEAVSMLVNPAYTMFKTAMDEMEKNPSVDCLSDVHLSLLMDGAQKDPRIIKAMPDLCAYLSKPELYRDTCVILSDVSHLNPTLTRVLLDIDIYKMLNYNEDISFSLVFSICDKNKEAWALFSEKYLTEEFKKNQKIQMLLESYS